MLSQTTDHRHRVLVAAAKHLHNWFIKVRKIKAIYHTLNMFNQDTSNKCLIAEGWIPLADISRIKESLQKGTDKSGSSVQPILNSMETSMAPPTFHRTNKFTKGFQALIEAYGIATYREVNPGLYTVVTFPFLFAVMFGDAGHAVIMLLFGLWMVLKEKQLIAKKSNNEIWNMFFGGRYIILLMGLFSFYTGVIYNDIFSKSMNIFGTPWHIGTNSSLVIFGHKEGEVTLNPADPTDYDDTPYPVGFDPMWQLATNKIAFQNSYKMKISVIIGVIHMFFGVMLSLLNHTYFKRGLNIVCEFIPQVIFLLGLFGWLCILVFTKWIFYGASDEYDVQHGTACAPSVLITFINMVLVKKDKAKDDCSVWMFEGQYELQLALLLISLLCVPVMLIPKPLILRSRHNAKMRMREIAASNSNTNEDGEQIIVPSEDEEEFEFGEVFIHQAIHTIEYVLGSVSHTASYLRLWALSLAHAQLSEVLWNMVLKLALAQNSTIVGSIMVYVIFAFWAALTISILVLMEGLSAFLHTLRLHWVEFCSKFYEGQGYLFTPFAFKYFIEENEDDA